MPPKRTTGAKPVHKPVVFRDFEPDKRGKLTNVKRLRAGNVKSANTVLVERSTVGSSSSSGMAPLAPQIDSRPETEFNDQEDGCDSGDIQGASVPEKPVRLLPPNPHAIFELKFYYSLDLRLLMIACKTGSRIMLANT
jgi:hypothetical protein